MTYQKKDLESNCEECEDLQEKAKKFSSVELIHQLKTIDRAWYWDSNDDPEGDAIWIPYGSIES